MSNSYNCDIHRSKKGPYYEMFIDGKFYGNYDTVKEAADDYEKYVEEKEHEQSFEMRQV